MKVQHGRSRDPAPFDCVMNVEALERLQHDRRPSGTGGRGCRLAQLLQYSVHGFIRPSSAQRRSPGPQHRSSEFDGHVVLGDQLVEKCIAIANVLSNRIHQALGFWGLQRHGVGATDCDDAMEAFESLVPFVHIWYLQAEPDEQHTAEWYYMIDLGSV